MNKIIETTAPLPISDIKQYFLDKDIKFLIDYENSKIQDKIFLTYISNLDIPVDLKLEKGFDVEKTFSLIDAYMDVKAISNIPFLNMIVVHIILKSIGLDTTSILLNQYLTEEQVEKFIETRKEKINKWIHFLDSTMLYMIYSYKELNEIVKVEENFPKIEDPNYIGLNVVNLFSVPGFMTCYFGSGPSPSMSFFTEQFTTYMFKGKNFFSYFNNEENIFLPTLIALTEGKLPLDPREHFGIVEQ